jgi:CheY-like chemotaxis protein
MPRNGTGPETVLVVENDPWTRVAIGDALTEAGFAVSLASNGFTGLRLACQLRPCVILLDLELPELSGAAVLSELRHQPATSDLAVILEVLRPPVPDVELVAKVRHAAAARDRVAQRTQPSVRRRRVAAPAGHA